MSTSNFEYPPVISYLTVDDGVKAVEFYKAAFAATERYRLTDSSTGKIGHCELFVNGGLIMLANENPAWNKSPKTLGGTPITLCLMVKDTDAAFAKAVEAGATALMPPADMFYGCRAATLKDPFGHQWMIQHEIAKVDPVEMQKRFDEMLKECK